KMKSLLPQCFVPVRYAHLHCALGEEDNQQQQSTTMFKVPNLFQDLTKNPLDETAENNQSQIFNHQFSIAEIANTNALLRQRASPKK
ncbi:MAG TPA: hypothetical protein VFC44_10860, partial [Candidatus Saccharimonadales bacterium]|nr:hypothetical protein [Candidatus Saccharimonadales bacterium]